MTIERIKYPRTGHVPWSEEISSNDIMVTSMDYFTGKRVIVTEKMDGENTTLYHDYIHARSKDSIHHESQSWVKNFWAGIKFNIPEGWRVCGENLYAKHSIHYTDLPTYFMGYSIWNENNIALDWEITLDYFDVIGIIPVPVLHDGIFNEAHLKKLWKTLDTTQKEGYVIRDAGEIAYDDFQQKVCKFVRKNHVITTQHWKNGPCIPNLRHTNER